MQKSRVAPNRAVALSISILAALVALTISGVFAATAGATETRSLTSSADTQIVEYAPTQNHGAATSLGVNGNIPSGSGKDEFALVKWDLSGIAPRTQVSSALVTLSVTTASPETYRVYVLKQPWVESAVTWTVYDSGKPWEVAGARGSLDRQATEVGSITPSVTGKNTLTLPLAVVQGWVDNPATNQGIIIRKPSSTRGFNFSSREVTDPTRRPQLTLNLSPDTTPPETTIDSGPSGTTSSGDVRFTFSSSEANSTFECRLDGATFASCTSPQNYMGLSDGLHTFEVRARDAAGNVDGTPASYTWTVDATAPTSSHTLSAPANQNGWHNANVTITLNGNDAQGSGVKELRYKINGGTEQVAAGSSKEFVISEVGTTTISYYAVDNAGNQQAPPLGNVEIKLDKSPPTGVSGVPNRSPDHNGWYNHPVDIVFTGQDQANLSGSASCTTVAYGNDANEPDGTDITVNGSCTDKAGNESAVVASSAFDYDDTPPAPPNAIDLLTDTGADPDDNITGDATPTFSVTAEKGSTVELFYEGTSGLVFFGSGTVDPSTGVANITVPDGEAVADGNYTVVAKATDAAGNVSLVSNDASLQVKVQSNITVDATPPDKPTLKLDPESDSGSSNSDGVTNDPTPTFSGTAEDGSTVELFEGTTSKGTTQANLSDGTWSIELTGVADGEHTYTAKATDRANNTSDTSAALRVIVDTKAPTVTIDSGPSGTVSSDSATFEFSADELAAFECKMDDEPFSACVSPKSYTGLAEGSHTFQVRAIDAAGNTDATSASRSWTEDTVAPNAPVINSPSDNSHNNTRNITVSGTAETGSTVEIFDGPTSVSTTKAGTGGDWSKEFTGVTEGSHTYTAKATDAAGNISTASNAHTVIVDVTQPETTIDSGPSGTVNSASATFEFSSNELGSTFECKLDVGAYSSCSSPQQYTVLDEGSHTFEVRATDGAGNVDPTPAVRHYAVQVPLPDTDGDGVPDALDKCQGHPDSADVDGDGTPDGCDTQDNRDPDRDGVQNWEDNCDDEAGPAASGGCPVTSTDPYPGLRYYKMIGVSPFPSWDGSASGVDSYYSQYMKPAYHASDGSVYFAVQKRMRWSQMLVDETQVPTHSQMRNPYWSGYVWNQPGGDDIAQMLNAQCVSESKCKVAVHLAITATAGDSAPRFLVPMGLGWEDGNLTHARFDKAEAVQYATEFLLAALDKYGSDPRIGSIELGEYYPGPNRPSGYDHQAYCAGYEQILRNVEAGAPRDAGGNRVTIYQTNPILQGGLTPSDFPDLNLGTSASDPYFWDNYNKDWAWRENLHGQIPQAQPGDSARYSRGYRFTWDGSPNPWGYTQGQSVLMELDHVAWFYGHGGPVSVDQEIIISVGYGTAQFHDALDQFGPGGTLRDEWGGVPYEK